MSDFIKISELAEIIGVHRTTAWRMIARGVIPAPIKIGRNITCWNKFEINEWLQNRPRFVTNRNNKTAMNLITTV